MPHAQDVYADAYHWRAHLVGGTVLDEYPAPDAAPLGFAAIPLDRLLALELVPQRPGLAQPLVQVSPERRPIFFRRRAHTLRLATGEQAYAGTIHVLGWQRTVGGRNVKALTAWYDDGSCVVTDDPAAL